MQKRLFLHATALAIVALAATNSVAQDNKFKIGLILPMTGQQASTGRQIEAAARLYMARTATRSLQEDRVDRQGRHQHSRRDKRMAQELVVNDKVNVLAVLASRRLPLHGADCHAGQTPMVVMARYKQHHTGFSLYRSYSFTLPQAAVAMATGPQEWHQKVVTLSVITAGH